LPTTRSPKEPLPILIENCRVVDGTGAPWRWGSVLIRGTTIEGIDELGRQRVSERIDGEGLVLSPGFIDAHVHTDAVLLREPVHEASLYQGVTTHILGQDGFGFAPTSEPTFDFMRWYTAGINGGDVPFPPGSIAEFLARFDCATAVNIATLIPNGCVRMEVLGPTAREATPDELERMAQLCRLGMAEGAVGLSCGLEYPPSCHASTTELACLAAAVAESGGVYVTHIRYGLGLLEGLEEAIEIGRRARVPVHVSHLRGLGDTDSSQLLGALDAALAHGVDVTYDVYPYVHGCTVLPYLLPTWVFECAADEFAPRLRDPTVRARIRHETIDDIPLWSEAILFGELSGARVGYSGLDLLAAANVAGRDPVDFVCDLLLNERFAVTVLLRPSDPSLAESDLRPMLRHRAHMVGSDGIYSRGLVHPRGYGSFARFLGPLVRDGTLPLEEAVRKATGATAVRFGLRDRGLIRPGFAADLVLFDPDVLADQATYEAGAIPATGVRAVFVNGTAVLRNGHPTGSTPGRALFGPGAAAS
jgi:N-acyl-D-amino-acid deacylase